MSATQPCFKDFLNWMVDNDDTEWLFDEHGAPSVTLCMAADLFNKDIDKATEALRRRVIARMDYARARRLRAREQADAAFYGKHGMTPEDALARIGPKLPPEEIT